MHLAVVILAAGQGTRMKSDLPKVLHPLGGHPLVTYSLNAARALTDTRPVLVVGHGAERVQEIVGDQAILVLQAEQLGTGHAVLQAESVLAGQADTVLVLYADMPLVRPETLKALVQTHTRQGNAAITLISVIADQPRGFGRVVRDAAGNVIALVEEAQATPEQLAIRELNAGIYCFDARWLWPHLHQLPLSPKGEYYLTDTVALAVAEGRAVQALIAEDPEEMLGINTRVHLAEAEAILRRRINQRWMEAGVTLLDPLTTYIQDTVEIGPDTLILPNTHLWGRTRVGAACILGPNTILRDTILGDRCRVEASVLEGATLEDDVSVGPFAHLRPGAYLAQGVHLGNFTEVKNARLGPGTKVGHVSYIGDATLGANVNIGAGTVTCNFDGERKHHTTIEDGAFIGSDTMLVAPVTIGRGAKTGAGAVVTRDVPPGCLAYGVPARVVQTER